MGQKDVHPTFVCGSIGGAGLFAVVLSRVLHTDQDPGPLPRPVSSLRTKSAGAKYFGSELQGSKINQELLF